MIITMIIIMIIVIFVSIIEIEIELGSVTIWLRLVYRGTELPGDLLLAFTLATIATRKREKQKTHALPPGFWCALHDLG